MTQRPMKLLEVLEGVAVSRSMLHNIVYVLENKYGFELGYRDCNWVNTAYGLYCEDIERDLKILERNGLVKIDSDGYIYRSDGYRERISDEEAYRVLKEAVQHYILVVSSRIVYKR